jgi:hypothetical protein
MNASPIAPDKASLVALQRNQDFSAFPGIFSCFTQIPQFFSALKDAIKSARNGDMERAVESSVIATSLPLGIAASAFKVIHILSLFLVGAIAITDFLALTVTTFVFLAIGLGLEIYRLIETIQFSKNYDLNTLNDLLKRIEKQNTTLSSFVDQNEKALKNLGFVENELDSLKTLSLNNLKSHLLEKGVKKLTDSLTKTPNKFSKAIGFLGAANLTQSITPEDLGGKDLLNEAKIKDVKRQVNKTLIVHLIGISAILFLAASIVLSMLTCPPLAVFLVGGAGLILEFFRAAAQDCFINQQGYKIDLVAFLPNWLTKRKVSQTFLLQTS